MGEYKPPFSITNDILSYVSSISEKIGRINVISNLESKPHLRKNNRMKSIHFPMEMAEWRDYGILLFYPNGNLYLNIFRLKARSKSFRTNTTMRLLSAIYTERRQFLLSLCCRRLTKFWMIFLLRSVRIMNSFRNILKNCLRSWNTISLIRVKALCKSWD